MKENAVSPDEALLCEIYKSVTMGSDSVTTIIGKTNDKALRTDLAAQLDGYQRFVGITREKLEEKNYKIKQESIFAKLPAEISINVTTMIDDSSTKIAEMMINGSTMGMIELMRKMRESVGASGDTVKLASDYVTFEEDNINKMKAYL